MPLKGDHSVRRDAGAWPLASLRQSFLNGALTHLKFDVAVRLRQDAWLAVFFPDPRGNNAIQPPAPGRPRLELRTSAHGSPNTRVRKLPRSPLRTLRAEDRGVQRKGFGQAGCSHQSESLSLAIHQATGSQRLRFCESDRCEAVGMSASRGGCKLEAVESRK